MTSTNTPNGSIQGRLTKAVDGNYRKRLNGMRKAVIDSVVFQRQLQERMYFDAFGETMEEAVNRRFDGKHVIL